MKEENKAIENKLKQLINDFGEASTKYSTMYTKDVIKMLYYLLGMLNSDKEVQECDATAAPSSEEPLAQKNPLEDITECYVVADSPTNMRVEEYADDLVNGLPFPLKSRYVKKITLPAPAVGGMPNWVKHLGKRVTFGYEGRKKEGIVEGYHPLWGVVIFVPSNVLVPYHYVREELIEWLEEIASPDCIKELYEVIDQGDRSALEMGNTGHYYSDINGKRCWLRKITLYL